MREYTIQFSVADADACTYAFEVIRHRETIFEITGCLVPGLAACNDAIAKDFSEDPL